MGWFVPGVAAVYVDGLWKWLLVRQKIGMKEVKGEYLKIPDGFEHRLIIQKCCILLGQSHLLEGTSEVCGMETQDGSCEDFKEKRWLVLRVRTR